MKIRHSFIAPLAACSALGVHAADNKLPEAKPADNTPKLAYGQMLKHGDKLVFTPCRDRSYAMLEDVSPDRVVTKALNSVGLDAGKKLYVELIAVVEARAVKASGINQARTEPRAAASNPAATMSRGGRRVTSRAGCLLSATSSSSSSVPASRTCACRSALRRPRAP